MIYHKVENNEIVEYNKTLPFSTPTVSFGVNTPMEDMIAYGYYPEVSNLPVFNAETHRNNGTTYEIVGTEVHKNYNIVEIPIEEIMEAKFKQTEEAVQAHLNAKCKERGYDNENSIAKYLVQGNPFYDECVAISLWIGSAWTYVFGVKTAILANQRTMPTIEELILELPVL